MFFKGRHLLNNLYDSHVHWLYTGQLSSTWNLKNITDPQQILNSSIKSEYYQGEWLTGFGWDENKWPSNFVLHRNFLDQLKKETPILLSRTDGHSSWVNTKALEILGFLNPNSENFIRFAKDIIVDSSGLPTGHLKETAHMHALFRLPEIEVSLKKQFLLQGAFLFNQAGFTHIRDMTSSPLQWKLNLEFLENPEFILHVEHWFVCEVVENLVELVDSLVKCKAQENEFMKIRGIKIFVDGSLGSSTACLSHHYSGLNHSGQMIWDEVRVKKVLRKAWKSKFQVAVHAIGDEASHRIVSWAREVYAEGIQGYLHLEHAQILRPETIQNMKSLHIRCHLQPCHWWGDQKWLEEKVGNLYRHAFPWEALRKAQIPFSFGSDSPIENSNLISNLKALVASGEKGIKKLSVNPLEFHLYPAQDSILGWTQFVDDRVLAIGLGERQKNFI
jgi:predicted amidohydrolase YtcJ